MAEIKSALEIALARTEGIETDTGKLREKELKIEGRKAAISFIDSKTDAKELKKFLKEYKNEEKQALMRGLAESFLSRVKLPMAEGFETEIQRTAEGLATISDDPSSINQMFDQLIQFFAQYLQNKEQFVTQLTQQFQPLLKQKEDAIFAQTGSRIKINPMDDPEFQKAYSQNMGKLEKQYTEAVDQAKGQLKEFFEL